jgi:hypothetical protein
VSAIRRCPDTERQPVVFRVPRRTSVSIVKDVIVHSVCTSAASVSEVHMLGRRCAMNYQGKTETIHAAAPEAQDTTSRQTRRGHAVDEVEQRKNRAKARVRSKVEWFFAS